jgi:hypothetical protein
MESNLPSSFIPKKPLVDTVQSTGHSINFFSLIASIIFITVLLIAGGIFGYGMLTKKAIESKKQQLTKIEADFQTSELAAITRLDNRIESAKMLLRQHQAMSSFYDYLSSVTLRDVQFTNFSYTLRDGKPAVSLTGRAPSFTALALQAAEFTKQSNLAYFANPSFSDFNLDSKGGVTFNVQGTVDLNNYLYSSTLQPVEPAPGNQGGNVPPPAGNGTGQ